jgi:enoyl-CoA hydratase/carnithine racemase
MDALEAFAADEGIGCIILTGNERAFAAGADIKFFAERGADDVAATDEITDWSRMAAIQKPIIGAVRGFALGGGCELAMACDWIIASERAVFGQPEVNLGIPPGFGGTQRLSRLVGRARALELVTTARQVKADEALAIGLVTRVVTAAELREAGMVVARSIAAKGPVAVRLAKQAVQRGQDLDLANACVYETSLFALAFATADQKEGMRAFVEKRVPRFCGE